MSSERYVRAITASTVERERVEWLMPGRVPLGSVTLLVGDGGLGKSTWTALLAGEVSATADVLIASAEDSLAATLRPRLEAVQADLQRVHFVHMQTAEGDVDELTIPGDVEQLAQLVEETRARLIVVDPLVAHLSAELNSWSDHSVRRALSSLHRLAEASGAAIVAVMHVNKGVSSDPMLRIGGSSGFRNAARSMLVFARDPEDPEGDDGRRRLLAHSKSNLSALAPTLVYELSPIQLDALEGQPEVTTTKLELVGESTLGHMDVLKRRDDVDEEHVSALDDATGFLLEELGAGSVAAKTIIASAKTIGIAEKTLRRAGTKLRLSKSKDGFGGAWLWALPEDGQPPWPPSQNSGVGHLRENTVTLRLCEPSEGLPEPKVANKTLMGTFGPGAGILGPGDPGYLLWIDQKLTAGHITEHELRTVQRLSSLVTRDGAAA